MGNAGQRQHGRNYPACYRADKLCSSPSFAEEEDGRRHKGNVGNRNPARMVLPILRIGGSSILHLRPEVNQKVN